jgi:hypothetical protein
LAGILDASRSRETSAAVDMNRELDREYRRQQGQAGFQHWY